MAIRRLRVVLVLTALAAGAAQAQSVQTANSHMAPLHEYLIADRNVEIALARSAAPESISGKAEVMVLGPKGYETAIPGGNHFVCLVERSWDGAPQFWNPKVRGPECLNAAATRFYLPIVLMKTRLALAGKSQAQIGEAVQGAFEQKRLEPPGVGAMSYMMSKASYLNDQAGHWHPHVMFFVPLSMGKAWGANLPGSPLLSNDDALDGLTIYMIPVASWSDGTPDANAGR